MKALAAAPLALLLISVPFAQQVGSVDLTRPQKPSAPAESKEERALPNGCEKVSGGGFADGWVEPEDSRPRDVVVEVIHMKDAKRPLGSELEAQVQLRNTDTRPIQIPWSTDPSVIRNGQDPWRLQWDFGTFEFTLRDQQGNQVPLKSLTASLYGSKFSAGSQLTIRPGESVTALVKFKLEDEYPIEPGRLKAGEWELVAEWQQLGRSWHVNNCEAWSASFRYDHFYRQQNPTITIEVTGDASSTSDNSSK